VQKDKLILSMEEIRKLSSCSLGTQATPEVSNSSNKGTAVVAYKCNLSEGDILQRYLRCVKNLADGIANKKSYWLEPCLVAEDIDVDILEMLPKYVEEYRVKTVVRDRNLFIICLSIGDPHNAAVTCIAGQAFNWNSVGQLYAIRSNGVKISADGNYTSAPDLVLAIPSVLAAPGKNMARVGKKIHDNV